MSEGKVKPASPVPPTICTQGCSSDLTTTSVQCLGFNVTPRMLRSPSHESVTTDLSLFSISSLATEFRVANRLVTFKSYSDAQLTGRGPSPKLDARQITCNRPANIPESLWFEEENELIRSCGELSTALGLRKSFSTSDISQLPSPENSAPEGLRSAVSALALDTTQRNNLLLEHTRLDHASRSCSTWVAVGEPVASTSQLPSPHGGVVTISTAAGEQQQQRQEGQEATPLEQSSSSTLSYQQAAATTAASTQSTSCSLQQSVPPPTLFSSPAVLPFSGADFVRSVNKKVRQNYIRRRLLTTYRALERLSQSEFNLDQLEAAATAAQNNSANKLFIPATITAVQASSTTSTLVANIEAKHALTVKDVERERGNQLSKYERNMMIFNWLSTLDDTATADSIE